MHCGLQKIALGLLATKVCKQCLHIRMGFSVSVSIKLNIFTVKDFHTPVDFRVDIPSAVHDRGIDHIADYGRPPFIRAIFRFRDTFITEQRLSRNRISILFLQ